MEVSTVADGQLINPEFRVGSVISRSLSLLSSGFFKFMVLAGLLALPQTLIALFGQGDHQGSNFLVSMVTSSITQGVIVYAAFQQMRGTPVGIGEALTKVLPRLLPMIGTGLLCGIAGGAGMILLIVPGLIAMLAFFVAQPVCVVERLSPVASMKRSAMLTKGYRWSLFGILVVYGLALMLVAWIGIIVIGKVTGGTVNLATLTTAKALIPFNFVLSTFFGAVMALVTAVIYHDLRVLKDGLDLEQIAAQFD